MIEFQGKLMSNYKKKCQGQSPVKINHLTITYQGQSPVELQTPPKNGKNKHFYDSSKTTRKNLFCQTNLRGKLYTRLASYAQARKPPYPSLEQKADFCSKTSLSDGVHMIE